VTVTVSDLYEIPQEFRDFQGLVRQIARERVAPRAAEIDREDEYPWDLRQLLGEQDVLGLPFPVEYGGTATGTLMLEIAVEELAKASASVALILMIQELGTLPIQLFGSDELKERLLPRCASGEWSPAFCLSEPEAGSDPAAMRTHARLDGDEWVLNGSKNSITNAGIADFYVVFAITDREERRITAFVVEKDRPGFSVAKLEHKLGVKGSPTGSLVLEGACARADRGDADLGKDSSMAKVFASDTAMAVTVEAVQVLGGYGYVTEYPVERMLRDAKVTQIYEGTNEIQRLVIARALRA
jgi:alkylation response protein AidB-like acyl-CoA dehydrogenase